MDSSVLLAAAGSATRGFTSSYHRRESGRLGLGDV
jgi:hypothetical protein